nr:hypothetical protein [Tanacetum cinerariifolium]
DPSTVKEAFRDHFGSRFEQPISARLRLNMPFPDRLSLDQVGDLEKDISHEEIRNAVWDCGVTFGFGLKWCHWIRGIFSSNMASVLVNGSPTAEFPIYHGLSINVNKSHVLGIGIPLDIVQQGAARISCGIMNTPFKYLGVMVGDYMSRYSSWSNTIQKVRARLSKWKVKTLSVGGSSMVATIRKVESRGLLGRSSNSTWNAIIREAHLLASKGFNFLFHCKIRVGDGSNTRFWLDIWILDSPLYVQFPRLFALESVKDISVAVKWGAPSLDASFRRRARDGDESNQWFDFCSMLDSVTLSSSPDRIFCDLNGEGEFRVKDISSSIDDTCLPSSDSATRWVKTVPIKVNILAWRTRL